MAEKRLNKEFFAIVLVAFALLQFPVAFPSAEPDSFSSATLNFSVSGGASVSGAYREISYSSILFPKEDLRQKVSCDKPVSGNGTISFSWKDGSPISLSYSCTVKTSLVGTRVSGNEPYPLESFGDEGSQFLGSGEKVKVNSRTTLLAKSIIGSEKNEFGALSRIASYVGTNITYDLAYFGKRLDTDLVLDGRHGVCEEFAHLFIALARSAGIPARYVGGYAWGGSGADKSFGAHGWAEAYFPGKGWVPFDPTPGFSQYGWLDSSHIKLYHDSEAKKSVEMASYSFYGNPPTISWSGVNPASPEISLVGGEGTGGTIMIKSVLPYPSKIFSGASSIVSVSLENGLNTATYASPNPIYLAGNLGKDENLILSGKGEPIVLGPFEKGEWKFVLTAPEIPRYTYFEYPISASVGNYVHPSSSEITATDGKACSVFISDGRARVSASPGTYFQTVLGSKESFEFVVPSSGFVAIPALPGKVFLSCGAYYETEDTSESVSVTIPSAGYSDENVEAVIFSKEAVTVVYSGKEYEIPSGGGTVPLGASISSATVTIRLKNGTERRVSGQIRRIEKPAVFSKIPLEIPKGGLYLTNPFSTVENGRLVSEEISSGAEVSGDGGYFIPGGACGENRQVEYFVEYEDLAGRRGTLRGNVPAKVSCSGVEAGEGGLFGLLARFFSWLFGGNG